VELRGVVTHQLEVLEVLAEQAVLDLTAAVVEAEPPWAEKVVVALEVTQVLVEMAQTPAVVQLEQVERVVVEVVLGMTTLMAATAAVLVFWAKVLMALEAQEMEELEELVAEGLVKRMVVVVVAARLVVMENLAVAGPFVLFGLERHVHFLQQTRVMFNGTFYSY
jgi:hypothetical protein